MRCQQYLADKNVPSMIYYPVPAHRQKMFESLVAASFDLPVTDWLTERVISLPMHTELDEDQLDYIVSTVLNFINNLNPYNMKIAVVGTGYVGLVTGTCFAETGNHVTCVDIDKTKVDKLSNGQITIYEPGLEKLFLRNLKEGRLHFTTDLAEGIERCCRSFSLHCQHLRVKMDLQI